MEKVDVAMLRPIEVIYVNEDSGNVILQTDTDDVGIGTTAMRALENMKQTSPAVIYLDTARYLLIGPEGENAAKQLQGILKESVQVCKTEASIRLKDVAAYLPAHGELPKYSQWKSGDIVPELKQQNGRIKIIIKR